MRVLVNLSGEDRWLRHSRTMGIVLREVLRALTTVNQLYIQSHHVPLLYESGVKYREEPSGKLCFKQAQRSHVGKDFAIGLTGPVEDFAAIPVVIGRMWGDCDDLAPWRCAELREQGEKAKIKVQWKRTRSGSKLFHIVVRRANGTIEDPSKRLGMGSPHWKNPELYM